MTYGGWDGCGPFCPFCNGEEQEGPFPCDCPLNRLECSAEVCQSYDVEELDTLVEKFNEWRNRGQEEKTQASETVQQADALPEEEVDSAKVPMRNLQEADSSEEVVDG